MVWQEKRRRKENLILKIIVISLKSTFFLEKFFSSQLNFQSNSNLNMHLTWILTHLTSSLIEITVYPRLGHNAISN